MNREHVLRLVCSDGDHITVTGPFVYQDHRGDIYKEVFVNERFDVVKISDLFVILSSPEDGQERMFVSEAFQQAFVSGNIQVAENALEVR